MHVVWMLICSCRNSEDLAGPRDSLLRQTSPDMDLDSPSILADSTGQCIGLNKTVLRRTVHTWFNENQKSEMSDLMQTKQTALKENYCSVSFLPCRAGGGIEDAACRVGSVELLLRIFDLMIS